MPTLQTEKEPRRYDFRPWATEPGEDLVSMPHALALDLVMALAPATHMDSGAEDWDADEENRRFCAHRVRMERMFSTITGHLAAEGMRMSPDMALRLIVMAYEVAPDATPETQKPN